MTILCMKLDGDATGFRELDSVGHVKGIYAQAGPEKGFLHGCGKTIFAGSIFAHSMKGGVCQLVFDDSMLRLSWHSVSVFYLLSVKPF